MRNIIIQYVYRERVKFLGGKKLITINPSKQNPKDNYRLLSSIVIPRPIAFVTTENEEGVINAAPFSFFNMLTSRPPLLAISVGRRNGQTVKDTGKNILSSKEFVVHIVDASFIEEVNQSSAEYPSHISEVEETSLTLIESSSVHVPGIKEAKIRMECRLHQVVPLGNDQEYSCDLFIGEVVMIHVANEIYREGKIIAENLEAISRLGGSDYAKIGETFSIERPATNK